MSAEPSEWHSFGDSPVPEPGAKAPVGPVGAPQPLARAAAHRNAWFAVGGTVLAVVAGLIVFVATIAMSGGGKGDSVIIAARSEPSARGGVVASGALEASSSAALNENLLVDVEGAVRSPGLHHVPAGSRIGDAITAAGGYADRADLAAAALTLNLAQALTDGAKIRVPELGEIAANPIVDGGPGAASPPIDGVTQPGSGLIDLNHADQAALESLPGIGPVTAGKIIAARESGPFASVDDLVSRKALGAGTLDKIRALVTVSP